MIECPKCGSRYLRPAKPRNFSERLAALWFVSPVRCRDCKNRFRARTVSLRQQRFARCPRCFRMDLSIWSVNSFDPPFWGKVKLSLGGHRWRCEYCRLSFVSFRRRKEVFSFRRWERFQPRAEAPASTPQTAPLKNVQGSRHD
jgi:DNA-directed RNA polymerase subunit RPC12/RpoP